LLWSHSAVPIDQMPIASTHHGTVVVEGVIDAPASQVYAAYADPKAREAWGAPSDTATFYYEEADFRVGGRDVARCGPKTDPRFTVESRYVDIVPERRIVWTETIREADKTLAASLTTLELVPDARRTRLKVTAQVTSFVGDGMIANTRAGHTGSLANMARFFEKPQSG
jgi:uncharacterized protein YndB with AHSA1/START domain